MEGIKRINTARSPKTPRDHGSPTFERLLQGDYSNWSASPSPTQAKEHDQEDHYDQQHKKSVLTKVKEKAKKLKRSLSKKKHGHEDSTSPSSGVALDHEEDEDKAPEHLGAPMYKSEKAPDACKETIRQQPRAVPVIPENHILKSNVTAENENLGNEIMNKYKAKKAQTIQGNGTITEAPKGSVSDDTGMHNFENGREKSVSDKGVSVKEYLMQKLEPGENDRALSQVITEAVSPRKSPGREMGVVEMVKDAFTSLLHKEETTPQPATASSSLPTSVSTHPQQDIAVAEEENHGRILQTN